MAKFYFHLRHPTEQVLDTDGLDCANVNAVAIKAMAAARDIIAADAKVGQIDMTYRIEVQDTSNRIVHSLVFEDAVSIRPAA